MYPAPAVKPVQLHVQGWFFLLTADGSGPYGVRIPTPGARGTSREWEIQYTSHMNARLCAGRMNWVVRATSRPGPATPLKAASSASHLFRHARAGSYMVTGGEMGDYGGGSLEHPRQWLRALRAGLPL